MEYLCAHKLIDEHGDSLYRFCRRLTYSKEDADDLFQETFLKVLERPHTLSASDNPQSVLFSTTLYIWKSWKRKYARRKRIAPICELDENVSSLGGVEDSLIEQEENQLVRDLVDALPDKFKIPIFLYYMSEFTVHEVAKTMSLPVGTVKSRLFKARKLIEKGLLPYEKPRH